MNLGKAGHMAILKARIGKKCRQQSTGYVCFHVGKCKACPDHEGYYTEGA